MAGEDRSGQKGANSGENRPMKLIGIAVIVFLAIAVLLLATGLAKMAPWDVGGAVSNQAS